MSVLVALPDSILGINEDKGAIRSATDESGLYPTCIAWDPHVADRAWCGTRADGVIVSDDRGANWHQAGLAGKRITAIAPSTSEPGVVWAGTEPSAVWLTEDGGKAWQRLRIDHLPSSADWSFPPKPETHHVRWIACHPVRPGTLWAAIEAGALISTSDGGQSWRDRVPGGPFDTHELAIHPARPDVLRVAAGDGYFESFNAGSTWASPMNGLDVGYLRSVTVDPGDPDTVLVSAATHAHKAYVAGHADGRLYRRSGAAAWQRVSNGWPEPPRTIAPLLAPGVRNGQVWAADERGVHRSDNGGVTWRLIAPFPAVPQHLRGLAIR